MTGKCVLHSPQELRPGARAPTCSLSCYPLGLAKDVEGEMNE